MNKVVLLILAGTLALLAEGCSFFSDFADARKELENETAKPNPVKVDTTASQAQEAEIEGEEFADLEEDVQPVQSIAGLIPATNPDTRVRSIVRGRQDPFSTVTLTPRIDIEAKKEAEQVSSENNRNFNRFNNNNDTVKTTVKTPVNNDDESLPTSSAELFQPTLAQEVVISGLYEAGGRTRLIIQAPEESTSRYVEVGQYLSNGKVLVKSIDRDHFPTPKVILEQAGVEVSKIIGESQEDSEDKVSINPLVKTNDGALISDISLGLN